MLINFPRLEIYVSFSYLKCPPELPLTLVQSGAISQAHDKLAHRWTPRKPQSWDAKEGPSCAAVLSHSHTPCAPLCSSSFIPKAGPCWSLAKDICSHLIRAGVVHEHILKKRLKGEIQKRQIPNKYKCIFILNLFAISRSF